VDALHKDRVAKLKKMYNVKGGDFVTFRPEEVELKA
jgi:hypothetical protein